MCVKVRVLYLVEECYRNMFLFRYLFEKQLN